jgi:23S rRNA (guanosine2251-2'-O)-methyltransferase
MEKDSSYIYGRNPVVEALRSGRNIEKIYISFTAKGDNISSIFSSSKKAGVPCVKFDKHKFSDLESRVCPRGANSQGVIALLSLAETVELHELFNHSLKDNKRAIIIALDGITDPQNLGAIARTALAAGAGGIILPERESAPISPAAMKASAGALGRVKISKVVNLATALEKAKESGFWVVGTDISTDKVYTGSYYDSPIIIVIGSEGEGIRPIISKKCDFLVKIPMPGKFNSLNASVSAGIILFEVLRQREIKKGS